MARPRNLPVRVKQLTREQYQKAKEVVSDRPVPSPETEAMLRLELAPSVPITTGNCTRCHRNFRRDELVDFSAVEVGPVLLCPDCRRGFRLWLRNLG